MCVVSMVTDHYLDKYKKAPWAKEFEESLPTIPSWPYLNPNTVTKEEFDKLKKDVEEMRDLLKRAMEYDIKTNQPHCEKEENVLFIKKLAEALDVDLSEIKF